MSRLRNAARSLASGYGAMTANILYTLASVPLALHYLSTDEFGLWALAAQIGGYLSLIDFGMSASVSRFLIDHKDTPADGAYGSVIQTGCAVLVVQGVLLAVSGSLLSLWLPALMKVPTQFVRDFQFLVVGQCCLLGFFFVGRMSSHILQAHQRHDILNYSQVAQFAISFAAQWLAFHWGLGVYSLLVAGAISSICGTASNLFCVFRLELFPTSGNWGHASYRIFKEVFAFGSELFLLAVGFQLLNASQIIIISRTLGLPAAALWAIATKAFVLANQVVARIFDYSGSALGEMIVRGERSTLRRRYPEIVLLTASFAVFVNASVVVCNGSFLTLWTKGAMAWPWWNDALMGLGMILTCVTRCQIGLAGYAKQVRTMRWIYFLEGTSFVVVAFLIAPHMGIAGILLAAIVANIACSGVYGIRWAARYLEANPREMVLGWLRPGAKYFCAITAVATCLGWMTCWLPPLPRLLISAGMMTVVGLGLMWILGLTERLRQELKAGLVRLRAK